MIEFSYERVDEHNLAAWPKDLALPKHRKTFKNMARMKFRWYSSLLSQENSSLTQTLNIQTVPILGITNIEDF